MPRATKTKAADFSPEALQLIDSFNPHSAVIYKSACLEFRTAELSIATLKRPKGDIYASLFHQVARVWEVQNIAPKKQASLTLQGQFCVMGVALSDSTIAHYSKRWEEHEKYYCRPWSNMFFAELRLFRDVVRLANETGQTIPAAISNAEVAWGKTLLRHLCKANRPESKREMVRGLRTQVKALKSKINPVREDELPELHLVIAYALDLSRWREEEQKLNNIDKQARGSLRKAVQLWLDNYRQALAALATWIDKEGDLGFARHLDNDELQITGERGKKTIQSSILLPRAELVEGTKLPKTGGELCKPPQTD